MLKGKVPGDKSEVELNLVEVHDKEEYFLTLGSEKSLEVGWN